MPFKNSNHKIFLKPSQNRLSALSFAMMKFTFIELLISIAIIAILASILVPSVMEAKRKTMISLCANNQRLISIALSSYVSNSKTYLPQHNTWATLVGGRGLLKPENNDPRKRPLNPYIDYQYELAICPSDQGDSYYSKEMSHTKNKVYVNRGSSYLPQWNIDNFATALVTHRSRPPNLYSFDDPEKKLFMADWIWHMNRLLTDKRSRWHSTERRLCNTLFLDGRVELFEFPLTMIRETPPNKDVYGWY